MTAVTRRVGEEELGSVMEVVKIEASWVQSLTAGGPCVKKIFDAVGSQQTRSQARQQRGTGHFECAGETSKLRVIADTNIRNDRKSMWAPWLSSLSFLKQRPRG